MLVLENQSKIVVPIFGAAHATSNRDTTLFFTALGLYQQCQVLHKIVEFKVYK